MPESRSSSSLSVHPANHLNTSKTIFDNGMKEITSAIHYLDSGNIDPTKTIHLATAMLNELNEARANLLAIRAQASIRQGKFDNAIADASKAIDTWPTSGKLYQLIGELHVAHGKPKLAIDALEDGIRSVTPSEWPPLYDKREVAVGSSDVKVDFVSVMPPEITARIFTWLRDIETANNELLICTMISKRWRATTLGCSDLWNVAEYIQGGNGAFRLLSLVNSYVKELSIDGIPERPSRELVSLATHGVLPHVAKVTLSFCFPHFVNSLISALGKQLTELKLDISYYDEQDNAFPLDTVLATCNNLMALTVLYSGENLRYQQSQLPRMDTLNIEMLSLWAPNDEGDFLHQLIPNCRKLRFLNLVRCPSNVLEFAAEHLSQLQEIDITDTGDSDHCIWMKEYKKQGQPITGLKKLEYSSDERSNGLRDLMPLWIKGRDTLQHLDFNIGEPEDIELMEQRHWDSLVSGSYPQLRSLQFVIHKETGRTVASHISKLLQLCPTLEYVCLDIREALPNDFFLTAFAGLLCLRRLEIGHLDKASGGLQQYLMYLSIYDQKCHLKEISINSCETITNHDLFAIADVYSLENITIRGPCYMVSTRGLTIFLRRLKSNTSLQYLELWDMEFLTDDCMPALDELVELNANDNKYHLHKSKANSHLDAFTSHYNIKFGRNKYGQS